MSEILTREDVQRSAHYVGMLVEFGIDSDEGLQNVRQIEASHLALHDALDAALEALRFYAKAESWKVWTGSTNGMCTARVDGGHEARKVLMDLPTLAATRTPDAAVQEGE